MATHRSVRALFIGERQSVDSMPNSKPPQVSPDTHALVLTVGELNALTRRGIWSRLGFSSFVAAIACSIIDWRVISAWLVAVVIWELIVRRRLETWTLPASASDTSDRALVKLSAVHGFGGALYATVAALGFLSDHSLGGQIAMGWIAGAAIHSFVYFSNRRVLLFANLAGPVIVALVFPTIAAGGLAWAGILSTLLTLTLVASSAVFATDRNALLAHLTQQINARRAAEEANAAKTQFLRTVSHELRTPLNAIIGYAELLEEDLSALDGQQRQDAAHISRAGKHLLSLINDILHLAQREANAPLLELDTTDLDALLRELTVTARELCAEHANGFKVEAATIEPVIVDRLKLTQCLERLLTHACTSTHGGLITLRMHKDAERLIFEVSDTGVGMAPEITENLFEPFVQPDGGLHSDDDTGLGLAVARKNARLMGGDISAESVRGKGSVFTLWLPLTHDDAYGGQHTAA